MNKFPQFQGYKQQKPEPEDLAELSKLYNYRRHLALKLKSRRQELFTPINNVIKALEEQLKHEILDEATIVQNRIDEIKTKFRMKSDYGDWRLRIPE